MEQKLTVANKVAYGMSDFGNNLVFVAATNYLASDLQGNHALKMGQDTVVG
ncbi:hypothetical protein GQS40_12885|uniref:Uncharacterized protein n=1 Tax=Leuconostoc lactis TaxID=1246 RepID=A0A6L7ACA7_LEULA|nr:hypothetical protein [Leuconostoc lactis]